MLNTFISGRRKRSSTERPTADVPERPHETDHNIRLDLFRALDTVTALGDPDPGLSRPRRHQ